MGYNKNRTNTTTSQRSFSNGSSTASKIGSDGQAYAQSVHNRMKSASDSARTISDAPFRGTETNFTDLNAPHHNSPIRNVNVLNQHTSNQVNIPNTVDENASDSNNNETSADAPLPHFDEPTTNRSHSDISMFDSYKSDNARKVVSQTLYDEFKTPSSVKTSDLSSREMTVEAPNRTAGIIASERSISSQDISREITSDKPAREITEHILDGKTIQTQTGHSGVADVTYTINRDTKSGIDASIKLNKEHKKMPQKVKDVIDDVSEANDNDFELSNAENVLENNLRRSAEKNRRKIDDYSDIIKEAKAERKAVMLSESTANSQIIKRQGQKSEETRQKSFGSFATVSDRWVDGLSRFDESNRFVTSVNSRFTMDDTAFAPPSSAKDKLSKEDLRRINDIALERENRIQKRKENNVQKARNDKEAIIERDTKLKNSEKRKSERKSNDKYDSRSERHLTAREMREGSISKEKSAKKEKKAEKKKASSKLLFANALRTKRFIQNDISNMSEVSADNLMQAGNTGLLRLGKEAILENLQRVGIAILKSIISAVASAISSLVSVFVALITPVLSIIFVPALFIGIFMTVISLVGTLFTQGDSGDNETVIELSYQDKDLWGCDGVTRSTPLSEQEIDNIIENLWDTYCTVEEDPEDPDGEYVVVDENMSRVQEQAVRFALSQVGCKYSQAYHHDMNGNIFDCSSLVYRAYDSAYTYLPFSSNVVKIDISNNGTYTAAEEFKASAERGQQVQAVSPSSMYPGDLIFWGGKNNGRFNGIYHVAIYVGNGKMVEARNEASGVVYCDIRNMWGNGTPIYISRPYEGCVNYVNVE